MRRDKYLSKSEMDALRASAKEYAKTGSRIDKLTWLCVDLALQTGLRVKEMAMIEVGDIDLERGCLTVNRLKRRTPMKDLIVLTPSMKEHIAEHLKECGNVFWNGERGRWTKRGLQQAWARACARAGIPRLSIHGARHTIAVHLLREKGNLRMVQKQLGHASPTTTANMYADVPFEDMVEALTGVFG